MDVNKRIFSFGTSSRNPGFIVVSMFTLDTPYEAEAEALRDSLLKHDVPFIIYGYDSLGSWRANCNAGIKITLEAMREIPDHNIARIDADAVVHSFPDLFDTIDCDIAAYKRLNSAAYIHKHKCEKGYHWETGTLFYRNCPEVQAFLLNQIRIMDDVKAGVSTESYLANDLFETCGLRLAELPASYSLIIGTDQPEEIGIKPVISHKLHGYKYKKVIR